MSATAPVRDARRARRLPALALVRDYGVVVCAGVLFVVLAMTSEPFLTTANLLNILDQQAPVLICAAAGTLVLIGGGLDLSVGATVALSGVVAAKVAVDVSPVLGLLAGAATGLAVGAVNGLLTTAGRVNSFIGTLATSFAIRGLAVLITGGLLVTVDDPAFTGLGRAELGGVKLSIWIALAVVLAASFLLARTTFGRHLLASGGNPEAARLAGVRVNLVRGATFAMSGLAAGVGGVIMASRVGTGQADTGGGMEFAVIAGIVVGGTSVLGGDGGVWRSVVGVLFIAMIGNGFNLLGVDPIYQQIVQGLIILTAIAVDGWSRRPR
ncbi:ABC transporter permease [Conexibacter woesei]|uniref:Inner-membrane translocator n=1 Tax=Conexibacter woesei (strain DSM 14684 / CCUG 47730 / CIP 108061 / JCM 11494 / NBRC 100937 / ID131577) TaxID=469383 RepID=D3F5H2_CONWI|nr:ABC transporter permease [Conexibacter woesei]ADB50639.1 inner-membrane translocator [Conexibacter woesei DSM 14684]